MILSKKKESIKIPLLKHIQNDIDKVNERLNAKLTSSNYRENHSLPEYNYQGIMPFSFDTDEDKKVEESKVGDVNMQTNFMFPNLRQHNISNYSRAVDQLDNLDLGDNDSNLFNDNNSRESSPNIGANNTGTKAPHNFLNMIMSYIQNDSSKLTPTTLMNQIALNKISIKNGKVWSEDSNQKSLEIFDQNQDVPMMEEQIESVQHQESAIQTSAVNMKNEFCQDSMMMEDNENMLNLESHDSNRHKILNENHLSIDNDVKPQSFQKDLKIGGQRQSDLYENKELNDYDMLMIGVMGDNEDGDEEGSYNKNIGFEDPNSFNGDFRVPIEDTALAKNFVNNTMNLSNEIFESADNFANLIQNPTIDNRNDRKIDSKYLEKLRNNLKSTLKGLIESKNRQKERQEVAIKKYIDFQKQIEQNK